MRALLLPVTLLACLMLTSPSLLVVDGRVTRRAPQCKYQYLKVPDYMEKLYRIGNLTDETLNFDSLAVMQGVRNGAVDLSEFINTARLAAANVAEKVDKKNPVATTGAAWNETWYNLGQTVNAEAEMYAVDGDAVSAADAFQRAYSYYALATRFTVPIDSAANDYVYDKSVTAFRNFLAQKAEVEGASVCNHLYIPYTINATNRFQKPEIFSGKINAYWCPGKPLPKQNVSEMPTVIVVNGYDGTAEMLAEQSLNMGKYGINQLFFEGPGQGYVARVEKQPFVPEYNLVTSTVLDYLLNGSTTGEFQNVNSDLVFVWGLSFGGYLGPRSFAFENRFAGLIADGGVYDMYDVIACAWQTKAPQYFSLYLNNTEADDKQFNKIAQYAAVDSFGTAFGLYYGELGFNVTSFSELLDALLLFNLRDVDFLSTMTTRPVAVNAPAWDTLTGNQSNIFLEHLYGYPTPVPGVNPMTEKIALDPYRGTGLHCGIGSTSNQNIAFARWIKKVSKFITSGARDEYLSSSFSKNN